MKGAYTEIFVSMPDNQETQADVKIPKIKRIAASIIDSVAVRREAAPFLE